MLLQDNGEHPADVPFGKVTTSKPSSLGSLGTTTRVSNADSGLKGRQAGRRAQGSASIIGDDLQRY
jgi:hypothetical protein